MLHFPVQDFQMSTTRYSGSRKAGQLVFFSFLSSQKYSVEFRVLLFEDHCISPNAVTCDKSSQASEVFREFCGGGGSSSSHFLQGCEYLRKKRWQLHQTVMQTDIWVIWLEFQSVFLICTFAYMLSCSKYFSGHLLHGANRWRWQRQKQILSFLSHTNIFSSVCSETWTQMLDPRPHGLLTVSSNWWQWVQAQGTMSFPVISTV